MNKPEKWLFVDFDNTMMATEQYAVPTIIERFNKLYGDKMDHPLTLEEFKQHFHGQARQLLCQNVGKHFGINIDCDLVYEGRDKSIMSYFGTVSGGITMADDLVEALKLVRAQGVGLAFVSNNPIQRGLAAMRFADNGRGDELAGLFGTNFFESGEVQKPDPDVYLRAIEQVGANPETSFAVEDSATGVRAAVGAGIKTFGFTGLSDDPQLLAEKLEKAGCIAIFNHWREFYGLFNSH